MVDEHFLSINLVLTVVKLFNIGNLTLFSSQFTCRGSNYFPSFNMWKVITFPVLKCEK